MSQIKRNIEKPVNLTEPQWKSVISQADEWGRILEFGYPGTKYIPEELSWDYSGSAEAMAIFDPNNSKESHLLFTPRLAFLS